jgi:hypothetical protein
VTEDVRGRRGVLATILLVLMTIGNAGGAIVVVAALNTVNRRGQGGLVPVLIFILVLQLVALTALVAIWTWHRWGLYLYGAALSVNLVLGVFTRANLLQVVLPIIFFSALLLVLRPRWPR